MELQQLKMKNEIFEKPFRKVKGYIKTKDFRTSKSVNEISLAKQEFLAEIKILAEDWFHKRTKKKDWQLI